MAIKIPFYEILKDQHEIKGKPFSSHSPEDQEKIIDNYWDRVPRSIDYEDNFDESGEDISFATSMANTSKEWLKNRRALEEASPFEAQFLESRVRESGREITLNEMYRNGKIDEEKFRSMRAQVSVDRVLSEQRLKEASKMLNEDQSDSVADLTARLGQIANRVGAFDTKTIRDFPNILLGSLSDLDIEGMPDEIDSFEAVPGMPLSPGRQVKRPNPEKVRMRDAISFTDEVNRMAEEYNLKPEWVVDHIRHNNEEFEGDVSRDALGSIHIKYDTLVKGEEAVVEAVKKSDLPEGVKARYLEQVPERMRLFRKGIVERVKKDMPELAGLIGLSDEDDLETSFDKISSSLIDSKIMQAGTAMRSEASKPKSVLMWLGNQLAIAQGSMSAPLTPPDTESEKEYGEALEQLTQLSYEFKKDQLKILGVDPAVIGMGLYSAGESAVVGSVTGPFMPVFGAAKIAAMTPKAAKMAQRFNNLSRVSPLMGYFGVSAGADTYTQAIESGMDEGDAVVYGALSGSIEAGVMGLMSFVGLNTVASISAGNRRAALETIRLAGRDVVREKVRSGMLGYASAFGKGFTSTIISEQIEENIITALDTLLVQTQINEDMTTAQFGQAFLDTVVATLFATGGFASFSGIQNVAQEFVERSDQQAQLEKIRDSIATNERTTEELEDQANRIITESSTDGIRQEDSSENVLESPTEGGLDSEGSPPRVAVEESVDPRPVLPDPSEATPEKIAEVSQEVREWDEKHSTTYDPDGTPKVSPVSPTDSLPEGKASPEGKGEVTSYQQGLLDARASLEKVIAGLPKGPRRTAAENRVSEISSKLEETGYVEEELDVESVQTPLKEKFREAAKGTKFGQEEADAAAVIAELLGLAPVIKDVEGPQQGQQPEVAPETEARTPEQPASEQESPRVPTPPNPEAQKGAEELIDPDGQLRLFQEGEATDEMKKGASEVRRKGKESPYTRLLDIALEPLFFTLGKSRGIMRKVLEGASSLIARPGNTTKSGKPSVRNADLKSFLSDVWKSINPDKKRGWENHSDKKSIREIAKSLAYEVAYAIMSGSRAIGWYSTKVQEALDHSALLHPELLTDPEAEFTFLTFLAIHSNGQDLLINLNDTLTMYQQFKDDGKVWPIKTSYEGERKSSIEKNLLNARSIIQEMGWEQAKQFFKEKITVREIREQFGYEIAGENMDTVVTGSAIMGPKIGAFWANLNGVYDQITMDLWFTRTLHRLSGDLAHIDPDTALNLFESFVDSLGDQATPGMIEEVNAIRRNLKLPWTSSLEQLKKRSPETVKAVKQAYDEFSKGGFQDKTETNNRSRNFRNKILADKDAPEGGGHRNWMRSVIEDTQNILQKNGIELTNADLQAILWFYEKDLYTKFGSTSKRGQKSDYAEAARQLIAPTAEGVGRRTISRGAGKSSRPKRRGPKPTATQLREESERLKESPPKPSEPGELELFQEREKGAEQEGPPIKASVFLNVAGAFIKLRNLADASSILHEIAHIAQEFILNRNLTDEARGGITDADIQAVENALGVKDGEWTTSQREEWARIVERYFYDGVVPDRRLSAIFKKIAEWMREIYGKLESARFKGSSIDISITPEVRAVLDKLVTRRLEKVMPKSGPRRIPLSPKVSLRHADTDKLRAKYGMDARESGDSITWQETLDEAAWRLESNARVAEENRRGEEQARKDGKPFTSKEMPHLTGSRLINDIVFSGRQYSDVEYALLIHELQAQEKNINKLRDKQNEALGSDNLADMDILSNQIDESFGILNTIINVTDSTGSAQGRSLNLRRMAINRAFDTASLAKDLLATKRVKTQNPQAALSKDEQATVTKFAKRIKDKGKALEEAEKKIKQEVSESEEQIFVDQVVKEAKQAQTKEVRAAERSRVKDAVIRVANAARERLKKGGLDIASIRERLKGRTLNQMAGESAVLPQFQRDSLETAKAMAAAGKTSEEIRAVTGWFPGKYDGKMRWEIPDGEASFVTQELLELDDRAPTKLEDLLNHPALFEAYPDLAEVDVVAHPDFRYSGGSITPSLEPTITVGRANGNEATALSTLLHEIQHAIQMRERVSSGTNPQSAVWEAPASQIEALRDEAKATFDMEGVDNVLPQRQDFLSKIRAADKTKLDAALAAGNTQAAREVLGLSGNTFDLELRISPSSARLLTVVTDMETSLLEQRNKMRENKKIADSGTTEDLRMLFLNYPFFMDKLYRANPGEIEARDVQARAKLTPEQLKATEPYSSENIAKDDAVLLSPGVTPAATARYVARFNQLTESLYKGRNEATAEQIDAWKEANPDKWAELSRMREEVLRDANYEEDTYIHETTSEESFTEFKVGGPKLSPGQELTGNDIWGKNLSGHAVWFRPKTGKSLTAHRKGEKREVRVKLKLLNPLMEDRAGIAEYGGFSKDFPHVVQPSDVARLKQLGKDSVVYQVEGEIVEVLVFDPNQIKSADPLTAGPKITPDQWGNPQSDNILHQKAEDSDPLSDLVAVGAEYIAEGLSKESDFTAALIEDFGPEVAEFAADIFARSKRLFNDIAKKEATIRPPKDVVKGMDKDDYLNKKDIMEMARFYASEGLEGRDILDAVTRDLQEIFPELTRDEVAEAFTDYGKTKYPSEEEISVILAELRNIERIQLQIQDVESGKSPKRTGFQRGEDTERVRFLKKELEAAYKRMEAKGVDVRGEGGLKSPLDAVKSRFRNEIEDLENALSTLQALPDNKRPVSYDEEANQLKEQRDTLRAEYDKVFSDPNKTKKQQLEAALKALERRIAVEEQMAIDGILQHPKKKKRVFDDPKFKEREAKLESLREARAAAWEALNPKQSPEEAALERAKSEAKKAIIRYDEIARTGDPKVGEKKRKYTPDEELKQLWSMRDTMLGFVKEVRKANRQVAKKDPALVARERAIREAQKSINEIERRIQNMDFTRKPRKKGLADSDPAVVSIRAFRDNLRNVEKQLERASKITKSAEELRIDRAVKNQQRIKALYEDKLRRKDFSKTPKPSEITARRYMVAKKEAEEVKAQWAVERERAAIEAAGLKAKAWRAAHGVLQLRKSGILGLDPGIVRRQGGIATNRLLLFNPKKLAKVLAAAFRSGFDATLQQEFNAYDAIMQSPLSHLFEKYNLKFHGPFDEGFRNREDIQDPEFLNALAKMGWGYKGGVLAPIKAAAVALRQVESFQRTYINMVRYDLFATLLGYRGGPLGQYTDADVKLAAQAASIATGRGLVKKGGKIDSAVPFLNSSFFISFRYTLSRFQYATLVPVFGTTEKGSGLRLAMRSKIFTELYVKSALGYAAYITLVRGAYMGMLTASGDKEKVQEIAVGVDPRDPITFLRMAVGESKIDTSSGIGPPFSFIFRNLPFIRQRMRSGEMRDTAPRDREQDFWNFFRNRMNVNARLAFDTLYAGQYFGGKEVNFMNFLGETFGNIVLADLVDIYKHHGPEGALVFVQMMIGDGPQVGNPFESARADGNRQTRQPQNPPVPAWLKEEMRNLR